MNTKKITVTVANPLDREQAKEKIKRLQEYINIFVNCKSK